METLSSTQVLDLLTFDISNFSQGQQKKIDNFRQQLPHVATTDPGLSQYDEDMTLVHRVIEKFDIQDLQIGLSRDKLLLRLQALRVYVALLTFQFLQKHKLEREPLDVNLILDDGGFSKLIIERANLQLYFKS